MAGLNITDVRDTIKRNLDSAGLSRTVETFARDPFPPDFGILPDRCVILSHDDPGPEYQGTFGASALTTLHLSLEVRTWSAEGREVAEREMDDLLSVGTGSAVSLFDALSVTPTLGLGTDVDVHIGDPSAPRLLNNSMTTYWSARIPLTIRTKRT